MIKSRRTFTIHTPVERVFAYVAEPANLVEWVPGVLEVCEASGEGRRRAWSWSYKMGGARFDGRAFVDVHEPPTRWVVKTTGIDSRWVFELEDRGHETRIKLTINYAIPDRLLSDLPPDMVVRHNEEELDLAVARLRDFAELRVPQATVHDAFASATG